MSPSRTVALWFRLLGLLPLAFYLVHPFRLYVLRGSPAEALWFCQVANLLLAAGMFFVWPRVVGVAALWLLVGTSIWAVDLAAGGELLPTSLLPHLGGTGLAVYAVRTLGFPKRTWLVAAASMLALQWITRCLTPPEPNVNLAFRVWHGWENVFPSYLPYLAMIYTIALASFFGLEYLFRRTSPTIRSG